MLYPVLSGARSFRLLTVSPGKPEETIFTRLTTAELPIAHGIGVCYDALSYVWGPQTDKVPITCNEEAINVTHNLHQALMQIRSESEEYVIWIDQLCINQDDSEERSREVALMGSIYSLARNVVVWLGPSDSDTAKVLELFSKLGRLRDFEASETYYLALGDRSYDDRHSTHDTDTQGGKARTKIKPILPPGAASIWNAVENFLNRPWFSRVWTLQEVVLAPACTVYCGTHNTP